MNMVKHTVLDWVPSEESKARLIARIEGKCTQDENGCLIWGGAKNRQGYGLLTVYLGGDRVMLQAHRAYYELVCGGIPKGLVTDHLCRVPSCLNPSHMEPVTPSENARRSPFNAPRAKCKRGHSLSGDNVRHVNGNPRIRVCRACDRIRVNAYLDRKRRRAEQDVAA